MIVVINGPPGVGKTTVSNSVARRNERFQRARHLSRRNLFVAQFVQVRQEERFMLSSMNDPLDRTLRQYS